jgi:hypothetical protein
MDDAPTLAELEALGFEPVAAFVAEADGLALAAHGDGEGLLVEGVVYLLTADEAVVYVGATQRALEARLREYRSSGPSAGTSYDVRMHIIEETRQGGRVEVWSLDPAPVTWNGLAVELYPGIECALIVALDPPWNVRRCGSASPSSP